MTFNCVKTLGYVTQETKMLISQRNVLSSIENDYAGTVLQMRIYQYKVVNISYKFVNLELKKYIHKLRKNVNIGSDCYF